MSLRGFTTATMASGAIREPCTRLAMRLTNRSLGPTARLIASATGLTKRGAVLVPCSRSTAVFLTESELRSLTKRQRPKAQARVLAHLGIPYKPRPDGSLVVLAAHVARDTTERKTEPKLRL
ncbi:MAG: DUF4224 domain-containing protein [Burkholderiales bacterium]